MVELARLTWSEAGEVLSKARLAIVPIGSLEQHGSHLTLNTDRAIADALAGRLADDLGNAAILCPSIPYGLSEHHLSFPGTLSLRPSTLIAMVLEIVECLAHWDQRRVLLVNGHGGNTDALRLASRSARRDHGSLVATVMWAQIAADHIADLTSSASYGHACEIETSVAMTLAPQTFRGDRLSEPTPRHVDELTLPQRPMVDRALPFEALTKDGALGDPRLASSSLGESIIDTAYGRMLRFAQEFMNEPIEIES